MAFDVQRINSMRSALGALRDQLSTFVNDAGVEPNSQSQARVELQEFRPPDSVQTAHGQGALLMEVVSDQLTAFLKTITEPVETIAPWTCTRSLLEAAALACWMFDPSVDVRMRVSRSLALRYEGLDQKAKWERVSGYDPEQAYDHIAVIESMATELGFEPIRDKNDRRIGIAQKMPSTTDLIRDTLDEEALYRLLSAIAHGHHWAIQKVSFKTTSAPALDPKTGVRVATVEKAPLMVGLAFLILKAATVFAKAVWYQATYFGWDTTKLTEVFEASFDDLNARDAIRFWRS